MVTLTTKKSHELTSGKQALGDGVGAIDFTFEDCSLFGGPLCIGLGLSVE